MSIRSFVAMGVNKHRPAPYLVCTYSFGEGELPTVRAANDIGHATEIARREAAAVCQPMVRIYVFEDDGRGTLVMGLRE
jgi:hypothetical protein